jgi:DNA-binding GntR family transcriptional regulator
MEVGMAGSGVIRGVDESAAGLRLQEIWDGQVKTLATAEAAHRTLREGILDRVLLPGTRLAEEEIAARFGTSRTPVREAILRLEAEGLAARTSGRVAYVTDLSPREIVEIYEVRSVIDGLAAELAAASIQPPTLANLEWLNTQLAAAGERNDTGAMQTLNFQFHAEVANVSGNGYLRTMLDIVQDRMRRFPGTTFAWESRWRAVVAEHAAIIETLRRGDARAAFDAARSHTLASRDIRIAMLRQSPQDS